MKYLIKKILKEANDLDWINNIEPTTKSDIANELKSLEDYGYYIHSPEKHTYKLVDFIYNLGLDVNQLDKMVDALYDFGESTYDSGRESGEQSGWEEGERQGYNEGHSDGAEETRHDCEDDIYDAKETSHDEGYDEGYESGYEKGFESCEGELKEKLYNKGFEEGRAYQSELDTEEYEKRQSGFDPRDYDDDYEN